MWDGQGGDAQYMGPEVSLLGIDGTCWDRVGVDILVSASPGPRIMMPATGESSEEMKCAGAWAPEFPISRDQCHKAISPPPQRDEGGEDTPVVELLRELPASSETRGPGHGDGHRGNPPLVALDTSTADQAMGASVGGADDSVVSLDMEQESSPNDWGLKGWDGDAQGTRGQAGLGGEPTKVIPLSGQSGEPQEPVYGPNILGTVADSGRHYGGLDTSSPSAPSLGRGSYVIPAGGSHGHLVNLVVEPPNLGPLRVKIQVRGTDVRALFLADGGLQKAALETGLWDLRQRLVHQGLSVQELAVQVGTHGGDSWQGSLSREGSQVAKGPSRGSGLAPQKQVSCGGAVTVSRAQGWGTLDLLI